MAVTPERETLTSARELAETVLLGISCPMPVGDGTWGWYEPSHREIEAAKDALEKLARMAGAREFRSSEVGL